MQASNAFKLFNAWLVATALVPVLLLTAREFLASESVSRTTCSALEYLKKESSSESQPYYQLLVQKKLLLVLLRLKQV